MRIGPFHFGIALAHCVLTISAFAQETDSPAAPAAVLPGAEPAVGQDAGNTDEKPKVDLSQLQLQVLRDFERFEKSLYDVAEVTRRADPERSELLFRARSLSQEQHILTDLQSLADLLKPRDGGKVLIADTPDRQAEVIHRMRELLKILQSADERDRLQREIERIQNLIKDTNHLIGRQRDVRADTGRGEDESSLVDRERNVAEDASRLAGKIDGQDRDAQGQPSPKSDNHSPPSPGDQRPEAPSDESNPDRDLSKPPGDQTPAPRDKPKQDGQPPQAKPADGSQPPAEGSPTPAESPPSPGRSTSPPSPGRPQAGQPRELGDPSPPDRQAAPGPMPPGPQQAEKPKTPGREELEAARDQMQRAIEELLGKQRERSAESQQEALAQLEQMKARLEAILRQLREEEKVLLLASLEARFQKLRKAQLQVNAETVRIEKGSAGQVADADRRLDRAVAISRDERDIVIDAEKALNLLKEEGSSVAFPEAVEQMRDNMVAVAERLNRGDTAETTQVVEDLIVETLDEMILALQDEMDRQSAKRQQQQQQQQQQESDPGLLKTIAELKMIRSLQNQINRLTRQIGRELESEQVSNADQLKLIDSLAARQKRLQQATYDLSIGKNQ